MICQECENLIQYTIGENTYGCKCKYGLPNDNYTDCTHFKHKIVPDKELRAEQKKELSYGKNPRIQPDSSAWKKKGYCDYCYKVLNCEKVDFNKKNDCKDWQKCPAKKGEVAGQDVIVATM